MSVQTTGHTDHFDHERWRHLCAIAAQLAEREARNALVVRHAARWLDQTGGGLRDGEIVVTWTVSDAALVRHQLRDRLPRDRVFPAAPRVRHDTATDRSEIPPPRSHGSTES